MKVKHDGVWNVGSLFAARPPLPLLHICEFTLTLVSGVLYALNTTHPSTRTAVRREL